MSNLSDDIRELTGYSFKDEALLVRAMTHSSRAYELTGSAFDGNERLEYLGDAVLELAMSRELYDRYPERDEGFLTKLRSSVVCEKSLSIMARRYGFDRMIRLGKGEERTGGRQKDALLADCAEAFFGAVYLDGGYEESVKVIMLLLRENIELAAAGRLYKDSKTRLQELLQARGITDIEYTITDETGPAHNRSFCASVSAGGSMLGEGSGKSKREAESRAADAALDKISEL